MEETGRAKGEHSAVQDSEDASVAGARGVRERVEGDKVREDQAEAGRGEQLLGSLLAAVEAPPSSSFGTPILSQLQRTLAP